MQAPLFGLLLLGGLAAAALMCFWCAVFIGRLRECCVDCFGSASRSLLLNGRDRLRDDWLVSRGGEGLLPWAAWWEACCCCCFPWVQRCWREWKDEQLREEVAQRHDELTHHSDRDTWLSEMSRRSA